MTLPAALPTTLEITVRKSLGAFQLEVELEVPEKQIVVLFGASGAGKSMTLSAIAGLVAPDAGRIVAGSRILFDSSLGIDLRPQDRRIGLVKQDLALFPHLTVEQNVAYGLFRLPRRAQRERVRELLHLMRLDDMAGRLPREMSGGQQQRVALARAIAPTPDLLLLDEPFSALDAAVRMELRGELLNLQRSLGIPMVFVTHDLGEAYFLADRLAVIDSGKILQMDAPGSVLQRPCCLPVARAVGVSNILEGVIEACLDGGCRVRVGQAILDAPVYAGQPGEPVHVCVRAERIMFVYPGQEDDPKRENLMFGEIVREATDGTSATLYFRASHRLEAPSQRDYDLQIELPVYIYDRLGLAQRRAWTVSLRKNALHLIP